jgi:predicted flap endonuclease-1-like 5' DNA nuclease
MIGSAIFAASFLFLFSITIVVPKLPPGEIISVFLGITETTSPISGISGAVFVTAAINGLFWGTAISAMYSLFSRHFRKKALLPTDFLSYPTLHKSTSEYTPPKTYAKRARIKSRKRRTHTPLKQNIETIEGIGRIYGKRLRKSGVKTTNDLLKAGSTRNGRHILSKKAGVSHPTILKWVYRADLSRIKGIKKQYSSLLESAGVNSVTNLSTRNPNTLYKDLMKINRKKNLVRRTPTHTMVKHWIEKAKNLRGTAIH